MDKRSIKLYVSAMSVSSIPVELRRVKGELTHSQFVFRGNRAHLLLMESGRGYLDGEGSESTLERRSILWLPPGKPGSISIHPGSFCFLLSFSDSLLSHAINDEILGQVVRQSVSFIHIFQQVEAEPFSFLWSLADRMERELLDNKPGVETMVNSTIAMLLVELWRFSGADFSPSVALPRNLAHGFSSLVDVHVRDQWSVGDYAHALGVTRDRLTTVIRRATGKTPLAVIHERLMEEARILLNNSNQQVAEIAFTLGFTDPAYFNRFFQRNEGITPARFRRQQIRQDSASKSSFAAWP